MSNLVLVLDDFKTAEKREALLMQVLLELLEIVY